ncbi:hypothetical protein EAO76_00365 [Streptomyces sp. sk2.1]|nr:hypothetical protein EAO76_00365 [Streptomyces sp. sk2.1]
MQVVERFRGGGHSVATWFVVLVSPMGPAESIGSARLCRRARRGVMLTTGSGTRGTPLLLTSTRL